MRISRIVLFILSILGGLATLCYLMPNEGISFGPAQVQLPSLTEILSVKEDSLTLAAQEQSAFTGEEAPATVEELVDQRLQELREEQEESFEEFRDSSDTRIFMADSTYLDPFFAALDNARRQRVRIMHYGDSQLEEDRITSRLRQNLQATYGGHGPGLVNGGLTRYTYTFSRTTVPDSLPRYLGYWPSAKSKENRYGPLCMMNRIDSHANISIRGRQGSDYPESQKYSRITMLMRGGSASFQAGDSTYTMTFSEDSLSERTCYRSIQLPRAINEISVKLNGPAEFYVLSLEDSVGVTVDNIALRGSDGSSMMKVARETLTPFFHEEPIRLIILQYGGNAMPYLKGDASQEKYMNMVRNLLHFFHSLAPEARILWIGPSDMSTNVAGQMKTYPWLPKVDELLRQTVTDEGCAYWSMYKAMGGYNSMVRWVKSSPQLAGEDYVHFTPKGASHISNILYETIELYYRYYRFRNHLDDDTIKDAITDTIQ